MQIRRFLRVFVSALVSLCNGSPGILLHAIFQNLFSLSSAFGALVLQLVSQNRCIVVEIVVLYPTISEGKLFNKLYRNERSESRNLPAVYPAYVCIHVHARLYINGLPARNYALLCFEFVEHHRNKWMNVNEPRIQGVHYIIICRCKGNNMRPVVVYVTIV